MTPLRGQVVILAMGVGLLGQPHSTTVLEAPAWSEAVPAAPTTLLELLPGSTALAVEIRDLASRWPEIRRLPAIAQSVGRLARESGLVAADLPLLAGERVVLALVVDRDRRSLVPMVLLRPQRAEEAAAYLERVARAAPEDGLRFAMRPLHGALWLVPAPAAERLEQLLGGDHGGLVRALPLAEARARLPAGGLVRGWVHPAALRQMLLDRVPGSRPRPVELLASMIAAELEVTRWVAFRRDLGAGGVETEAIVAYSAAELPPALRRALRSPGPPVTMPVALPRGVVAMSGFRPEPEAGLAWLRHVSRSDPRGPLRNLDFWLDELEERTGMDLEQELAAALGEEARLFVLAGAQPDSVRLALLIDTPDAPRLEHTLLGLRSWVEEQAWGRTLGFLVPRSHDRVVAGRSVYGLSLWSPLGMVAGPAFQSAGRHLVIGSDESALRQGLRLLATRESWRAPSAGDGAAGRARGSMVASIPALAGLTSAFLEGALPELPRPWVCALDDLLGGLDSAHLAVWSEGEAIRLRGRIRFRDQLAAESAPQATWERPQET